MVTESTWFFVWEQKEPFWFNFTDCFRFFTPVWEIPPDGPSSSYHWLRMAQDPWPHRVIYKAQKSCCPLSSLSTEEQRCCPPLSLGLLWRVRPSCPPLFSWLSDSTVCSTQSRQFLHSSDVRAYLKLSLNLNSASLVNTSSYKQSLLTFKQRELKQRELALSC